MSQQGKNRQAECNFIRFGLIVTGKSESEHLPKLFRTLMATGMCSFKVIRLSQQRGARTSKKRKMKMAGKGKTIPTKDEQEIGLPARKYLNVDRCHFLIFVDDLEYDRRPQAQQLFERYRLALDTMLTDEQKPRASVHFLVNMLEAYYFADAQAINQALELNPPLQDYSGDVETIRHPKSELKKLVRGFNEIKDGGKILEQLNIEHVLSRADTCAWLRTLFAWCVKVLERHPHYEYFSLDEKYQLRDGLLSEVTQGQLNAL